MRYQSYTQQENAKEMRRLATDAEKLLWQYLRGKRLDGCKFRRQVAIGSYIADFLCAEMHLVIEVDGGQHGSDEAIAYDARRTAFFTSEGFRVLRFWNNDVLQNIEGVLTMIRAELLSDRPSPSQAFGSGPSLSPEGRGVL